MSEGRPIGTMGAIRGLLGTISGAYLDDQLVSGRVRVGARQGVG